MKGVNLDERPVLNSATTDLNVSKVVFSGAAAYRATIFRCGAADGVKGAISAHKSSGRSFLAMPQSPTQHD